MKKVLLSLLTFCALSASAQTEIVVGDMNDDGKLSVGDITALTETVVGRQAVRRINVAGDPYAADNTSIVGQWSGVSGKISFYADGTTDYKEGYTYEYLPAQCMVMFYDSTGAVVESLQVMKLNANNLVLANASLTQYYTYGTHGYIAEDGKVYYKDENGHTYVDLGLPSGTLWAECNIGANEPSEFGYYFAWGEVETKSNYYEGNYFDSVDGTYEKYNLKGGLTKLDPEDDAATVNWGDDWCMPSEDQIEELIYSNYTACKWVTHKNVKGYLIVSKSNGAAIFLPAAGEKWGDYFVDDNVKGCYWTRSLAHTISGFGRHLFFSATTIHGSDSTRSYGQSVRPVRK